MRSFRYNKNAQVIRGFKEDTSPKRRRNWDRIIYLIIIFIVLFSLGYYLFRKNFFASSYGEVITSRFEVKFADDVKVLDYFVEENQVVAIGDTILTAMSNLEDNSSSLGLNLTIPQNNDLSDWVARETSKTRRDIQIKQAEYNNIRELITSDKNLLKKREYEVYLGLVDNTVLEDIKQRIASRENNLEQVQLEIKHLRSYLYQLQQLLTQNRNQASSEILKQGSAGPEKITFISPLDGIVNQIYQPLNEINYKKEVVLDIIDMDHIFIMAYLPQDMLGHFNVTDTLGVKFGNGSKSLGVISNIYFNTAELPDAFQNNYENHPRTVLAKIVPIDEFITAQWKAYYKMAVLIYRPKLFYGAWKRYMIKNVYEDYKKEDDDQESEE